MHPALIPTLVPAWLHILAVLSLLVGFAVAALIGFDVALNPQPMWIMNAVWPLTGLFAGPLALWGYFRYGRSAGHAGVMDGAGHGHPRADKPFYAAVGIGATHCGAGCTLGDIVAEWLAFGFPAIALWFGYRSIFPDKMFAVWILDYIFAFAIGIGFQYFAIAPMRGLSFWPGLAAALKADTLSLTSWQVGMYGFMALAQFGYFRPLLGKPVAVDTAEFWFTMQLAMLAGFITAYPVNWWLIKSGIKEKM